MVILHLSDTPRTFSLGRQPSATLKIEIELKQIETENLCGTGVLALEFVIFEHAPRDPSRRLSIRQHARRSEKWAGSLTFCEW